MDDANVHYSLYFNVFMIKFTKKEIAVYHLVFHCQPLWAVNKYVKPYENPAASVRTLNSINLPQPLFPLLNVGI